MAALAVALLSCAALTSEPAAAPQQLPTQAQADMNKAASDMAETIAKYARFTLGNLHPSAQMMYRKWLLAVRDWRKDTRDSAVSYLAEGTLFDCYIRTLGLRTGFSFGLAVDKRFQDLGLPERPAFAAELFDKALQRDPSLREAEFRRARIRASKDAKAVQALERLAMSEPADDVSYLAAVSRGQVAQERKDTEGAISWFGRALTLRPHSTAAAIALSALQPSASLPLDAMDADDLFYTYPCTPMTAGVADELRRRIEKVVLK